MIKKNTISYRKVKVLSIALINPDVYILKFARFSEFKAGQMVRLAIEKDGTSRLYSIASGEKDYEISILFDEKPGGALTPLLSKLKTGDEIWCSEPFGTFLCKPGKGIWIATGTGIAPFVSMVLSKQADGKMLIHGSRTQNSFYYNNVLESVLLENYIRCCSGENVPGIYFGRLTNYLQNLDQLDVNQLFYLCGNAEMVVETRDILINKGVHFDNIVSEIYF